MTRKFCLVYFLILSFLSCKTVLVKNEVQQRTTQNVIIGTIGLDKNFIIESDYNSLAIPMYLNPVKLSARLIDFNKVSFKAFEKAVKLQSANIAYDDTTETKSKYLKLEISDRIEVLKSLNGQDNKDVFELLKNKKESHVVTSIAIVFSQIQQQKISNAEEIFLEPIGVKSYSLNIYKDGLLQEKIKFNEGVVFSYQTSYSCWKQNDKYQLEIIDLVEGNDKCPNGSFRSSNRAKKKINYYKF
ncbi:hypothetical protein [Psychroserpens luteus]|uniref:Lipoprotein n=1 Tax=Psychroserpens luteus TaxID=1434066 RepID=A0ABW5ZWP1_9FLAO|nr:hypothetical protein [Psychroserpens luteus]